MVKIHLVSDPHIEAWKSPESTIPGFFENVSGKVDLIVLAGDIAPVCTYPSAYKGFIEEAKKSAEHVVVILGNHEFYHGEWNETIELASSICNDAGVHLLDINTNPEVVIEGRKIWGSTLWTDLSNNDPVVSQEVEFRINDYSLIRKGYSRLLAKDTYNEFIKTKSRIDFEADLIVTHHSPLGFAHSRFPYSAVTHGFCCFDKEIENNIIQSKNNKLWLFGHTHDNRYEEIGGVKIVSNCLGYPREKGLCYNPDLILKI